MGAADEMADANVDAVMDIRKQIRIIDIYPSRSGACPNSFVANPDQLMKCIMLIEPIA
jgi:hypothetical protein